MRKGLVSLWLACAALCVLPHPAAADTNVPAVPTITVAANGDVEYVPDIARVSIGIRAESSSAASAADSVNKNAAQVIAAVMALGINQKSIKTTGYNLEYREPQVTQESPVMQGPPAPVGATPSMSRARPGKYVASEILQVTAPVKIAGNVLDAAIGAGANESFGVSYLSSSADRLYRVALARAVQSARDTAQVMASAAHVSIAGIESITNVGEQRIGFAQPFAQKATAPVAIMPGTDLVSASVYVVFRIR